MEELCVVFGALHDDAIDHWQADCMSILVSSGGKHKVRIDCKAVAWGCLPPYALHEVDGPRGEHHGQFRWKPDPTFSCAEFYIS